MEGTPTTLKQASWKPNFLATCSRFQIIRLIWMVLFDDYQIRHYFHRRLFSVITDPCFDTRRVLAWAILTRKTHLIHIIHHPKIEPDIHVRIPPNRDIRVSFIFTLNSAEFLITVYRQD